MISTHTLRGERDFREWLMTPQNKISTHTLRGERDLTMTKQYKNQYRFQLTRSVGSVTHLIILKTARMIISTHTLRGERDVTTTITNLSNHHISTHTLRGERDKSLDVLLENTYLFQLTRSVGSVTRLQTIYNAPVGNFNSHAPWGA